MQVIDPRLSVRKGPGGRRSKGCYLLKHSKLYSPQELEPIISIPFSFSSRTMLDREMGPAYPSSFSEPDMGVPYFVIRLLINFDYLLGDPFCYGYAFHRFAQTYNMPVGPLFTRKGKV
ncbi:hypothetical protein scyTo_0002596 [Scyliorhinus torazame]|uniref:Uncharacterized protein n=1 Tax=Scyliorhinus torazame TaxID=75743 RepID=A0A401PK58_SCYTO|nr:hypothetical protein [Scyliorhinus torazame]